MPTGIFPLTPYYTLTQEIGNSRFTRVYEDGTYRTVLRSPDKWEMVSFPLTRINETERDLVQAFHDSHMQATTEAAFEFYWYDPRVWEGDDPPPDSSETTGRRIAIFLDQHLTWKFEAACRFSTTINLQIIE